MDKFIKISGGLKKLATDKVWLYRYDKKKFVQLESDDPRLDWNYEHTPRGTVKYQWSKNNWNYFSWGNSKQEAADNENYHKLEEIKQLQNKIEAIKATLVKVTNG